MYHKDLFDTVLLNPMEQGATSLFIVSGYATPAMVYEHFETVEERLGKPLIVNLIIGMATSDGILRAYHNLFKRISLQDYPANFKCYYLISKPAAHSKVYAWDGNDTSNLGFVGSANYTLTGFKYQREAIAGHDSAELRAYFASLLPQSIECIDPRAEEFLKFNEGNLQRAKRITKKEPPVDTLPRGLSPETLAAKPVVLTQLDQNGQLPTRSGLNWGQRPGRNHNQAYLRVPANIARSGFFPPRGQHFTIITDDGKSFDAVIAQDHSKAIETPKDNSILGLYIRTRLGLNSGDFVSKSDLENYGRTDVTVTKIDDETYYLDFSAPNDG